MADQQQLTPSMQKFLRKHQREAAAKLDLEGKRQCSKCGHVKPHSHMKKDSKRKFGIQRICKDCDNVVWPKTAKWRAIQKHERMTKLAAKQLAANPPLQHLKVRVDHLNLQDNNGIPDDVRRKGEMIAAAVETYFKPIGTPQGLTPHPDKSLLAPPSEAKALPNDAIIANPPYGVVKPAEQTEDEQVRWWGNFFAASRQVEGGLTYQAKPTAYEKKIAEEDLPEGLRPGKPHEIFITTPADEKTKAAVASAIPQTTVTTTYGVEGAKKTETAFVESLRPKSENSAQIALRAKMERDGFSPKMIEGAVKLLPMILKELKELDIK